MPKRKTLEQWKEELIGKKFGRLTVLEVQPYYDKNGKRKGCQVLCRCSCGNTKITPINSLVKGLTTSCGCLQKECSINKLNYWRENNPDEVIKIKKK